MHRTGLAAEENGRVETSRLQRSPQLPPSETLPAHVGPGTGWHPMSPLGHMNLPNLTTAPLCFQVKHSPMKPLASAVPVAQRPPPADLTESTIHPPRGPSAATSVPSTDRRLGEETGRCLAQG